MARRSSLIAVAIWLLGCTTDQSPRQAPPRAPTPPAVSADAQRGAQPDGQPVRKAPAVVLTSLDGSMTRVDVEIVRTAEERRVGLMFRKHLPPESGMLFLFEEDEVHSFWMKNTLIPLDMIFIRADMTVAGVVENAEPLTEKGRSIGKTSRHVLEVNGGFASAHGIGPGTRVTFENVQEKR